MCLDESNVVTVHNQSDAHIFIGFFKPMNTINYEKLYIINFVILLQ